MKTWSRVRSRAVWTLTLVLIVAAPTLVQAQQTGLFPMRPIRRERVPCAAEDPVYRLHREQYYGYFPTCWRKFPAGWGCMSPEAPDAAASFAKIKRGDPPSELGPEGRPMEDEGGMGPDPRDAGRPDPADAANVPALPPGRGSLFEQDDLKPGAAPPERSAPPGANPPPGGAANLPAPLSPAASPMEAEIALAPREAAPSARPGQSLLALPETPSVAAPALPAINPLPPAEAAPTSASLNDPALQQTAQPAQAPQRRSIIGSFFGGLFRR